MKICFFIRLIDRPGGMERMTSSLANELFERGHEVYILTLEKPESFSYMINPNILIHSFNQPDCFSLNYFKRFVNWIITIFRFWIFIRKYKIQCVINVGVHMSRFTLLNLLIKGVKTITWEHFNLYAESKLSYYWRIISTRVTDLTIVLTEEDRINYLKKSPKANVISIPNFTSAIPTSTDLDSKIILAVGRFTFQKGFDLLLQIWSQVNNKISDWSLYIVGDGEEKENLINQSIELGITSSVHFIPSTKNISSYYSEASIFVLTSRFEGLPMVLIEAQTHGVPCVSFNCQTGPSEIIENGVTGIVIDNQDVALFSESLIALMNNRDMIKKMGANSITEASKKFNKYDIVTKWNEIIINLYQFY